MENNNLKNVLKNSMGSYYKASNKLIVYTLSPYKILSFSDLKNGNKLKTLIEEKCYQSDYELSDKIVISEEKLENNKLFDESLFSGMSLDNVSSIRSYEAFANENILFDLYAVDINKDSSVLNFINKYGLLGADKPFKSVYYNEILLPGQNISSVFEDYEYLIESIKILQDLIELWSAYKNDKIKINDLLPLFNYGSPDISKDSNKHILNAPKKAYKTIAKTLIWNYCNAGMRTVSPVLKPYEYEVNYTSNNLLGVLYVHLYKIILNQRNSYTCDYCGKVNFYNTNGDINKFCRPPKNKIGHSECNNNYNNMRRLTRYKIIKNKYDFNQIKEYAKKIKWSDYKSDDKNRKGRDFGEVLEWIEDYEPGSDNMEKELNNYKKEKPETFKKIKMYLDQHKNS